MASPTDPNADSGDYGPQGGPGYGGGTGSLGAGDPYFYYMSLGSYDPYAVQQAIYNIIHKVMGPGEHMSQADLVQIFSLMNTYGQQNVGFDAEIQNKMNSYVGDIQQLNQDLHQADVDSKTGVSAVADTAKFESDLSAFRKQLASDEFFKLPGQSGMQQQILSSIDSLSADIGPSTSALAQDWDLYNGTDSSGSALPPTSAGVSGIDPGPINAITSDIGVLGSQMSGSTKGQLAKTQYDTTLTTTEQDTLNNLMKKLYSLYLFMLGQMKTQ